MEYTEADREDYVTRRLKMDAAERTLRKIQGDRNIGVYYE